MSMAAARRETIFADLAVTSLASTFLPFDWKVVRSLRRREADASAGAKGSMRRFCTHMHVHIFAQCPRRRIKQVDRHAFSGARGFKL